MVRYVSGKNSTIMIISSSCSYWFVNILSMRVAVLSVTLVGRFIRGMNEVENTMLTKSDVGVWLLDFNKSILKSPSIYACQFSLLIFCRISRIFSLKSVMLELGGLYTQPMIMFLWDISISTNKHSSTSEDINNSSIS